MNAPKRIRLSRAKGWRLPTNAVNVARPGKWGNPFIVGKDGTRTDCVAWYAVTAAGYIVLTLSPSPDDLRAVHRHLRAHVAELKGKDLACWCALDDKPCHADVLLLLANEGWQPGILARFIEDRP